jgi:hypothetical protein
VSKLRATREADNLTAICEPIFFIKCGIQDVSQPSEPPLSVTGIALLFFLCITMFKNPDTEVEKFIRNNFSEQCRRPLVWSSGQSFWVQIQRSGLDSRRYQIFWEAVGLERGPLSLVNTTEELLGRQSSGSDLDNINYVRRDPLSAKVNTNFTNKRWSLGRYTHSSHEDTDHAA